MTLMTSLYDFAAGASLTTVSPTEKETGSIHNEKVYAVEILNNVHSINSSMMYTTLSLLHLVQTTVYYYHIYTNISARVSQTLPREYFIDKVNL